MLDATSTERLLFIPLSCALLYVVLAPGTKVEESFNIQATHDLLFHTTHIAQVRFTALLRLLLFVAIR
jgi:hypothetical protein